MGDLKKWVAGQHALFSMEDAAAGALNLGPDMLTPGVRAQIGRRLRDLGCTRKDNNREPDPSRRRLYRSSTHEGAK